MLGSWDLLLRCKGESWWLCTCEVAVEDDKCQLKQRVRLTMCVIMVEKENLRDIYRLDVTKISSEFQKVKSSKVLSSYNWSWKCFE